MRALIETVDDTEVRESKYANLQSEQQQLRTEMESLSERKKNIQLIND